MTAPIGTPPCGGTIRLRNGRPEQRAHARSGLTSCPFRFARKGRPDNYGKPWLRHSVYIRHTHTPPGGLVAVYHGTAPTGQYAKVPNDWVRCPGLSLKAKGLLSYLRSHESGYRLTVEQVVAECMEGKGAIYATLTELIDAGYVRRIRRTAERGKVASWDYLVVGADGEFPQVGATSGFSRSGEPRSGATSNDAASSQVVTTSGLSRSGKSTTKKTMVLEDQEKTMGSELNWPAADAAGDDAAEPVLTPINGNSGTRFEDWNAEDYELFRFLIGADSLYSDGSRWPAGEHATAVFYRSLRQRTPRPIKWPGRYFDQMNTTGGIDSWLKDQGLDTL